MQHMDALLSQIHPIDPNEPALPRIGWGRVMETDEVESTVKQLCAEASAQRDPSQFKSVLVQLRKFLHEHNEVLRSMSDDTFEALRKVWYS